jgi:YD repeat-containing protein
MLKVEYIRDGNNQIIGTATSGLPNGDIVVRDREGRILGHANTVFNTTRDADGRLISRNAADVGLLFHCAKN